MDSLLKMEDRTAPVDSTENAQWRRSKTVTLAALFSIVFGAASALPATAANTAPTDSASQARQRSKGAGTGRDRVPVRQPPDCSRSPRTDPIQR